MILDADHDYRDVKDRTITSATFSDVVGLANCSDVTFQDCYFTSVTLDKPGVWVGPNCSGIKFINCVFENAQIDGAILVSGDVDFIDCVFNGNGVQKVYTSGALGAAGIYSDTLVNDVLVKGCTIQGSTEFGINLVGSDVTVQDSLITKNDLSGIYFREGSSNNHIINSVIVDNGLSNTRLNQSVWRKEDVFDPWSSVITVTDSMIGSWYGPEQSMVIDVGY